MLKVALGMRRSCGSYAVLYVLVHRYNSGKFLRKKPPGVEHKGGFSLQAVEIDIEIARRDSRVQGGSEVAKKKEKKLLLNIEEIVA